ncbi:MAG: heavy-metal-associated domain-containing protein [Janthinobacterium lividum]
MKVLAFSLLLALGASSAAQAQTAPVATTAKAGPEQVQFKTSAVCDMCKARLEKSLAYEKGVQAAHLDVPSKVLTVTYNPAKTTPAALQTAVQKTGYDADQLTADARAYDRLPECCKKTAATH